MSIIDLLKPLIRVPLDDDLRQASVDDIKTVDAVPLSLVDKMSPDECRNTLKLCMTENVIARKALAHVAHELSEQDDTIAHLTEIRASGVGPSDISKLEKIAAQHRQSIRTCNLPQSILSKHLRKRLGLEPISKKK